MTNKLDLNAIRKRAEAATKGNTPEWYVDEDYPDTVRDSWSGELIAQSIPTLADAEFIASARTDVVELIAEVERLRQALWEITVYPPEDALEIAEEALEHGR